ncbi:MAG: hypothetical protein VX768_02015, partial [Planctomycetota bacterium]|nr:hypothetical protein [Planctomycetota bacterium]
MFTSRIAGVSAPLATQIFGLNDRNLKELRERHQVDILYRDGEIRVSGDSDQVIAATRTLEQLRAEAERNGGVTMFRGGGGEVGSDNGIVSAIDIVQSG